MKQLLLSLVVLLFTSVVLNSQITLESGFRIFPIVPVDSLAISTQGSEKMVVAYPNPSFSLARIRLKSNKPSEINEVFIYDSYGTLLQYRTRNLLEGRVANWGREDYDEPGIYYFVSKFKDGEIVGVKVVVL